MIDANPLSPNMNAYCDLAFANAYFTFRYGAEAWADFDDFKKEALLVRATNTLDTLRYGGLKFSKTQPLLWPRTGIYDDEGTLYSINTVPVKIKQATCEMAHWFWTEDDRYFSDTEIQQVNAYKVGPLSVTAKNGAKAIPQAALDLISAIGAGTLIGTSSQTGPMTMSINL
jgi:hypothetical protein